MTFRLWCHHKWLEHQDELSSYSQPLSYTSTEYFNRYKWWLRREFRANNPTG